MNASLVLALLILLALFSYLAIEHYLSFAIRKQIIDIPNHRSSHTLPVPRGGGVAFSAAFIAGIVVLAAAHVLSPLEAIATLSGLAIALVGYWDDLGGVPIRVRLAMQLVVVTTAVLCVFSLGSRTHTPALEAGSMLLLGLAVLALTWLLNLTNFMDGIDGIVTIQIVSVGALCAGLIVLRHGFTPCALLFVMLVAAVAPFLLFNWSPARLFMGDAGSCFLGFTMGVLVLIAARHQQLSLAAPIILFGVFLSDATLTLLTRMLRGERWYLAHRTHAFQILALRFGHRRVSGSIGLVNLVWLAPLALLAEVDSVHALLYAALAFLPLLAVAHLLGAGGTEPVLLRASATLPVRGARSGFGIRSRRVYSGLQLALIAVLAFGCSLLAMLLHYDGQLPVNTHFPLVSILGTWAAVQCGVLALMRIHRMHWRFVSIDEVPTLAVAGFVSSLTGALAASLLAHHDAVSIARPIYFLDAVLSVLVFSGYHLLTNQLIGRALRFLRGPARQNVLIGSADASGISILSELRLNYPNLHAIGFIDDRAEIQGFTVCGLRVLKPTRELARLIKKHSVQHIFVRAGSASATLQPMVEQLCRDANIPLSVLSSFRPIAPHPARAYPGNFFDDLIDTSAVRFETTSARG
ncbi:hypothetical protein [Acidipila sp. EB88]|uniref:hypothetical protein n=1 Tax=Acidipila sp. EB88 TaxID=2305226 RepID=UPI0013154E00|nr:hypothetical protein [Acidipila sp. EB88]